MIFRKKTVQSVPGKNDVLLTWIISYVVMLLVPLLLSFAGHVYSEYALVNTLYKLQEESAQQMQRLCDEQIDSIQKMALQISSDSRVKGLLQAEDAGSSYGDFRMNLKETFDYLRSIMDNDAQIVDVMLLDYTHGYIVSAQSASNAYDSNVLDYMQKFSMTRETFWNYVRGASLPFLIFTDSEGNSDLYYHSVIVTDNVLEPAGTLLIRLDLTEIVPVTAADSIPLLILDDSMVYNVSCRSILDEENFSSLLKKTKYGVRLSLDGRSYDGVMRASSSSRTIRYFYGTDPDYILKSSIQSIYVYLILVIASIIMGGFLAVRMSRRQYNPLQELADYMHKQQISAEIDERGNIYEVIRNEYADLLTKATGLKSRLESEREILISNTFDKLLKGRYRTEAMAENALDDFGITLERSNFHTLLVAVDDYVSDTDTVNEAPAKGTDPFDLVHFLIVNIGLEYLREVFADAFSVDTGLSICFIINHDAVSEDLFQQSVQQAFDRMADLLKQKMHLSIQSYCSKCHDSLLDLSTCYSECLSQLENNPSEAESSDTVLLDDIRSAEEKKYRELLMEEDFAEALTAFYHLLDEHPEQGYAYHLFYLTIVALHGSNYEEALNGALTEAQASALHEAELCELIRKFFVRIASSQKEQKISAASAKAEKIRGYIDAHIYDENLNLATIAQEFGITESYVTRLLRTEYGIHVNTYINGRRVEYIKQLMRVSDLTVQEVSARAGYVSYRTMIRVFRQFENKTPTEYRKSTQTAT